MSNPSPPDPVGVEASRSRLTVYGVIVLAVVLIALAAGVFPRLRQHAAVAVTTGELAIPTVILVEPSRSAPPSVVRLPAEIKALTEAPILARATGYVRNLSVDIGSSVTNGQVLAELETPELNQQLGSARAMKQQAEAALNLAKTTAARWSEMRAAKIVSSQEADEKAADAELKVAALGSAASEVRRLEELVGFARLTAPFDGIITARRTDTGQLVVAGSGVELFRLAQTRVLRVFVRVPQSLAGSAQNGIVAQVLLNEQPGRTYPARLIRTAGAIDPASRTLLVELELPNPDGTLLPGTFAQIEFPTQGTPMGWTIPANTLLFRAEGLVVAVVDTNGVVELRRITTGRDLGATVEVTAGLDPTTRIVLNPPDALATGMHVRIADTATGETRGLR